MAVTTRTTGVPDGRFGTMAVVSHEMVESGAWWASDPVEQARLLSEYRNRQRGSSLPSFITSKEKKPEASAEDNLARVKEMERRLPAEGSRPEARERPVPDEPERGKKLNYSATSEAERAVSRRMAGNDGAGERHSRRWSEAHRLPQHNLNRPSRTPEARRLRHLISIMRRDHITLDEAEALHPSRRKSAPRAE